MTRVPIWLLILLLCVWIATAEDVTGPAPIGANVTRPPVVVGGVAYPSPDASPVAKGKADRIATDGQGSVWVKLIGSIASTISGTVNVTNADNPLNVTNVVTGNVTVAALTNNNVTASVSGNVTVVGPAAHDTVNSGAPVKAGGVYRSAAPSVTDGDVVDFLADAAGRLAVGVYQLLTADMDSGAGTQTGAMVGIAVPASGGAVAVPGDGTAGLYTQLHAPNGFAIGSNDGMLVCGPTAHDGAVTGAPPVRIGGNAIATGTLPTAVSANNDTANLLVDRYGRARVGIDAENGFNLATSSGLLCKGQSPHDAFLSGEPFRIGARAEDVLYSAVTEGNTCDLAATRQGQLRGILDDNANAIGHSVKYEASHAGGATEVTAKASAGLLKWINVSNPNTTDVWLQIHDATNPAIGTDVPLVAFVIPGGTGASNRAIYNQEFGPVGITFATAITYTITTTAGGITAPGSAVSIALGYK